MPSKKWALPLVPKGAALTKSERFISFAQNGEDVVLNRVLADVEIGHYIEVGANHPLIDSVSRSFYDRGWSGIAVEPNPAYADLYREERPRDAVIEAAATDSVESSITLHLIEGTGLSTLVDSIGANHVGHGRSVVDVIVPTIRLDDAVEANGLDETDIHFLVVDTEGAELQVLRSMNLTKIRPWILVIESTAPESTTATHLSWEPLVIAADYHFCLFDGLSRFYVSGEKKDELAGALSYPACVFDDFVTVENLRQKDHTESITRELERTREALAAATYEVTDLRQSRSWRITRPLRAIHARLGPR